MKKILEERNKEMDEIFEEIGKIREALYHAREAWQLNGFEHEMTEKLIKGYEEAISLCHKNLQIVVTNFKKEFETT